MKKTHLRQLSVFVDEPDPGVFFWVLHESTEDASIWLDIDASEESFVSWIEAFDRGVIALMRLVPNELIGPRSDGESEGINPVG